MGVKLNNLKILLIVIDYNNALYYQKVKKIITKIKTKNNWFKVHKDFTK